LTAPSQLPVLDAIGQKTGRKGRGKEKKPMAKIDTILDGKKTFSFSVEGLPIDPGSITMQTVNSIVRNYGNTIYHLTDRKDWPQFYSDADIVSSKVHGPLYNSNIVNLKNYYTANGAKITKALRTFLTKELKLTKKDIEPNWAKFCKEISEFYYPRVDVEGSWEVDKDLIGEGIMESGKTCLSDNGENRLCKIFITKFSRIRVLFLRMKNDHRARARCLAFFPGGRRIALTNFYYRRFPGSQAVFVKALEHGLNVNAPWKDTRFDLEIPVYKNGDDLCFQSERRTTKTRPILYPCPHCGTKTLWVDLYDPQSGPYNFGCSSQCVRNYRDYDDFERDFDWFCESCEAGMFDGDEWRYRDQDGSRWILCHDCYQDYERDGR
jgi:hypothetical protein